jgi:hypothetical protein
MSSIHAQQHVDVEIRTRDGTSHHLHIPWSGHVRERCLLAHAVELDGCELVYREGVVPPKRSAKRMRMPPSVVLQAKLKTEVTRRESMVGELRGDGCDVSKFVFADDGSWAHAPLGSGRQLRPGAVVFCSLGEGRTLIES